jgi:hypothetical protein
MKAIPGGVSKVTHQNARANRPMGMHMGKMAKNVGMVLHGADIGGKAKNCTGDYWTNKMLQKGPRVRNHGK